MTDAVKPTPEETPSFDPDSVEATRGREQGLGVGARELAAQRDPGGVQIADDQDLDDATDTDALNQNLAVQGEGDEETQAQGAPTA